MIQKFLLSLSFFTRIPIGKHDFGTLTLAQSAVAFPIVGGLIGLLDGMFYLAMLHLSLNHYIAAWLTIIFHLLLTGGLHEDGLADTADALASGRSIEQKLAIMRDSKIGSYGVLALISIVSLKAYIIASLSENLHTLWIFIAAAACSRAFLAIFMRTIPYAQKDGLAAHAGKPAHMASLLAVALGSSALTLTGDVAASIMAILALATAYIIIRHVCLKNFGGITGDTLGATQQISEVVLLLVLLPA